MRVSDIEGFAEGPERIIFDEIDCCALANAFAKNPEAIKTLSGAMDPKKLKASADILINTTGIGFQRNEEVGMAYSQMAEAELERLKKTDDPDFYCAHSEEEHEKALKSVIEKLKTPLQ